MKVTVCCGELRVVVPCDDGSIDVNELTARSCTRIKRMLMKGDDFEISLLRTVQNAILFPDDTVKDVLDDQDVVIAVVNSQEESTPCLESLLKASRVLKANSAASATSSHSAESSFQILKAPSSTGNDYNDSTAKIQTRTSLPEVLHNPAKLPLQTVSLSTLPGFDKPEPHQSLGQAHVVSDENRSQPGVEPIFQSGVQSPAASFQCRVCSLSFIKLESLAAHVETHKRRKGSKEAQCSVCQKILKNTDNLKKHMFIHTDKRPFACEECKKRFRSKSDLRVHIRIHTGEKPYHCEFADCGKSFNDRSSFRRHGMSHRGVKRARSKQPSAANGNATVIQLVELTNGAMASIPNPTDVTEVVISHAPNDGVNFNNTYEQSHNAIHTNPMNT